MNLTNPIDEIWNSVQLLNLNIRNLKDQIAIFEARLIDLQAVKPPSAGPIGFAVLATGAAIINEFEAARKKAEMEGDIVDQEWARRLPKYWLFEEALPFVSDPAAKAAILLNCSKATMMSGLIGQGALNANAVEPRGSSYVLIDSPFIADPSSPEGHGVTGALKADMKRELPGGGFEVTSTNFRILNAPKWIKDHLAYFRLTSGPSIRRAAGMKS